MKGLEYLLLTGEAISLLTVLFLFFKVLVFLPECFSLFDAYVSVLPLLLTKIVEIKIVFFSKTEKRIKSDL